MRRISSKPRDRWKERVEAAGVTWHTAADVYWNESAFYEFNVKDVDALESATNELAKLTLEAAQHIIDEKLYSRMAIPEFAVPLIENSWAAETPSVYGRFDLAYDGIHPPKLLEYNADTPTSLLEAAVVQWYWLEDVFPLDDQFNSIHERLIARWGELMPSLPERHLDFCSVDDAEDGMTVAYLLDTARQAGLGSSRFPISMFPINEIGWDGRTFVGPGDVPLTAVFKLYPWEWMIHEEFGPFIGQAQTVWIEPPWKMLLSNKGILPVLWELNPGHPNLLPARLADPGELRSWVKKPLLGREGANVTLHQPGLELETGGDYGSEGFVYQEDANLKDHDGKYVVVGSWVVGHDCGSACGVGVRESSSRIIDNTSAFVPHVLR